MLVPKAIEIARRTMRVVKSNILFTAIYNMAGLSLAAFGILPPVLSADLQSLPDVGILANSAWLIHINFLQNLFQTYGEFMIKINP